MCVCHICNQSLTNVTVYIQVYMQVYLLAPGQGQGLECVTGHIEHMQNGSRIISLVHVPLLALES